MNNNWQKVKLRDVIYPVSETFNFNGKDKVHFLNTGDILEGKLLQNQLVTVKNLPGQAKNLLKKEIFCLVKLDLQIEDIWL